MSWLEAWPVVGGFALGVLLGTVLGRERLRVVAFNRGYREGRVDHVLFNRGSESNGEGPDR